MDSEYKRRIADQYLHPLVKEWWYGLTESERDHWLRKAAIEKSKIREVSLAQQRTHSIREQNNPHDGTKGDMLYLVGNNLQGR